MSSRTEHEQYEELAVGHALNALEPGDEVVAMEILSALHSVTRHTQRLDVANLVRTTKAKRYDVIHADTFSTPAAQAGVVVEFEYGPPLAARQHAASLGATAARVPDIGGLFAALGCPITLR